MNDLEFVAPTKALPAFDEAFAVIREKARDVRFGTITLTIHDGKLTQLEVSEKRRFAQ